MSKYKNDLDDIALRAEGAEIAEQLTPLMTLRECAERLGMSKTTVQDEERRALGKIARAMREFDRLPDLG